MTIRTLEYLFAVLNIVNDLKHVLYGLIILDGNSSVGFIVFTVAPLCKVL